MYKKAAEEKIKREARRVVTNNPSATRSPYDKPFFALPGFMTEDYQKIKTPLTPNEFIRQFCTKIRERIPEDLLKLGTEKYKLFEEFPFGKLKGSGIKDYASNLCYEDEHYMVWMIYQLSKTPYRSTKLIRSLYYYIPFVRDIIKIRGENI